MFRHIFNSYRLYVYVIYWVSVLWTQSEDPWPVLPCLEVQQSTCPNSFSVTCVGKLWSSTTETSWFPCALLRCPFSRYWHSWSPPWWTVPTNVSLIPAVCRRPHLLLPDQAVYRSPTTTSPTLVFPLIPTHKFPASSSPIPRQSSMHSCYTLTYWVTLPPCLPVLPFLKSLYSSVAALQPCELSHHWLCWNCEKWLEPNVM